jgi:hypothetical protein
MNSRRHFFKQLAGEIARGVQEVTAPSTPQVAPTPPPEPHASPVAPAPLETATPTERGATLDELLTLAEAVGLGARHEAIRTLARASVRLTPAGPDTPLAVGGSRLGGAPDLPEGTSWPHWRGLPLTFRVQLDLAKVAGALAGGGGEPVAFPIEGTLACFSAAEPPDGMRPDHMGACAALLTAPVADVDVGYGQPAVLSRELVLPRVWAAPVAALELDPAEQEAWSELRSRLATSQGVEPADEATDREAPHRLLGYPDERRGEMPLACALLAEGLDPAGEAPALHPRARALEPSAARWRLLFQLVLDDRIGWHWGKRRERLYVWVHEDDLAAGGLSRLRAFVQ